MFSSRLELSGIGWNCMIRATECIKPDAFLKFEQERPTAAAPAAR
jgi:hypothetical protein